MITQLKHINDLLFQVLFLNKPVTSPKVET